MKTLSEQATELLHQIEVTLPASESATNLAILAGDLLRAINLGDAPRGEWTMAQRKLLNLPDRPDDYVAYLTFKHRGDDPAVSFLRLCDSSDEGAFKVYRNPNYVS